jgi:hypothetical protein
MTEDACTQNWPEVEERLKELKQAYTEIGQAGAFVREFVLYPLQDRWDKGERSRALAEEVMAVSM